MPDANAPLLYLITDGALTPANQDFSRLLRLIAAAVNARFELVQIREKKLPGRALYELARQAVRLTKGSQTRLLLNDRADIARAAGADGVHLTAQSLEAAVIRRAFGPDFVIGVSTHTLAEARAARDGGADFATFGPVFDTLSKRAYGPPVGLEKLAETASNLPRFPVFALGGIALANAPQTIAAGAAGLAAISLFAAAATLDATARQLRFPDKSSMSNEQ